MLCVFAHPDDECLGPGGTIAKYAMEGVEVNLLTFTRGEAGSIGISKELDPEDLATALRAAGFVNVEVRYRFPDQPDAFTQRVMRLESMIGRRRACYYFGLTAQKAPGKGNGCAQS